MMSKRKLIKVLKVSSIMLTELLIFTHFFRYHCCQNLVRFAWKYPPGEISITKSTITNNNSFRAYAIEMQLDKFIQVINQELRNEIAKFKAIQGTHGHRCPNDVIMCIWKNAPLLYFKIWLHHCVCTLSNDILFPLVLRWTNRKNCNKSTKHPSPADSGRCFWGSGGCYLQN